MSDQELPVCGCGHPDCPECNPAARAYQASDGRITGIVGLAPTKRPHALNHVVVILQQTLSDGRRIHVERALTWHDLRNLSVRDYEIGRMVEQVAAEVQRRCGG